MLSFIQRYFLNFWVWWYVVNGRVLFIDLMRIWGFTLGYFDIVPMAANFFNPLFQDYSREGRIISIPIRFVWIIVGLFLQILVTVPLILAYISYLLLPLLPVAAIVVYLI